MIDQTQTKCASNKCLHHWTMAALFITYRHNVYKKVPARCSWAPTFKFKFKMITLDLVFPKLNIQNLYIKNYVSKSMTPLITLIFKFIYLFVFIFDEFNTLVLRVIPRWETFSLQNSNGRKEGRKMFFLMMNTTHFIYGYMASDIIIMVKDHSDSKRGNLLPPHRLLFPIPETG